MTLVKKVAPNKRLLTLQLLIGDRKKNIDISRFWDLKEF